jgi:hypothetical protein
MTLINRLRTKEVYVWEAVPVVIKNLLLGPTYLEYGGTYALKKINSGEYNFRNSCV